jgi:hypothetical protein
MTSASAPATATSKWTCRVRSSGRHPPPPRRVSSPQPPHRRGARSCALRRAPSWLPGGPSAATHSPALGLRDAVHGVVAGRSDMTNSSTMRTAVDVQKPASARRRGTTWSVTMIATPHRRTWWGSLRLIPAPRPVSTSSGDGGGGAQILTPGPVAPDPDYRPPSRYRQTPETGTVAPNAPCPAHPPPRIRRPPPLRRRRAVDRRWVGRARRPPAPGRAPPRDRRGLGASATR